MRRLRKQLCHCPLPSQAALAAETYFEGKNADPLLTGLEKIAFDKGRSTQPL